MRPLTIRVLSVLTTCGLLAGAAFAAAKPGGVSAGGAVPVAGPDGYRDFVPIDPMPSPKITYYDPSGNPVTKAWAELSTAEIAGKRLCNIHTEISVARRDTSGNLTYLVAKATAEAGDYRVVMDYSQYVPESVVDPVSGREIGQGRVGVGMRMSADIHTTKAGIDLGSIFALGVAASTSKLRGSLTVDIIGVSSSDIGNLVVTNATIDASSVQKTLEGMAAIKVKIPEAGTTLTPQLLAVKPTKPGITPDDVRKELVASGGAEPKNWSR